MPRRTKSRSDSDKNEGPVTRSHDTDTGQPDYTEEKHDMLSSASDNYARDPAVDVAHNQYAGIQGPTMGSTGNRDPSGTTERSANIK
ncbi:hypothetical protein HDE_04831 [Halotydeus destructor]|nr:hypothetical protein HDE_04831 [Halotydeus destructor]